MSAGTFFKKYYSIRELENILTAYIKANSSTGIDKMTYKNFSDKKIEHLNLIHKKVREGTYSFTPYKEKLIVKSRNSYPRLISIPTIRDKVVLKALHLVLAETFSDVRQPLPQNCIEEIKKYIHQFDSFIKLDISDFYGSIRHGILIDKLKKRIRKPEILSLIFKAITTPTVSSEQTKNQEIKTRGVPQGLSISNMLAQIYLDDLDRKFSNISNLKYIRYVDDIIILCSSQNIKKIYNQIKYELEGIFNLSLNLEKVKMGSIAQDGFDFLGYSVKSFGTGKVKLTVKSANKEKFEDSIVGIFANYKHSIKIPSNRMSKDQFIFTLNNKITGSISSKVSGEDKREFKYGWLFYFSQIEDTGILYHLDWFVEELLKKFNLDHINRNSVKSFVKTFYEIKYNVKNSDYLHKPDELGIKERKQLLINTFKLSEYQLRNEVLIEKYYRKLVYRPIKENEKDIRGLIS